MEFILPYLSQSDYNLYLSHSNLKHESLVLEFRLLYKGVCDCFRSTYARDYFLSSKQLRKPITPVNLYKQIIIIIIYEHLC